MNSPACFNFGLGQKLTVSRLSLDYENVKSSKDGAVEFILAGISLLLASVFVYIGVVSIITFFSTEKPMFILFFGILFGSFGCLVLYQFPTMARLSFKSQITRNADDLEIKIAERWPLNIRTERVFNYPSSECVVSFTYSYISKRDEHDFYIELTHIPSKKTHIITSPIQPNKLDPSSRSQLRTLVKKISDSIIESGLTTQCQFFGD